ncbi:MAG: DUF2939 domain-containing protein [Brevundimonas sp.]
MNRKYIIAGAAVVAVGFVALYAASPVLAFQGLRSAAEKGDRDKLEKLVDFPSVRDSLKSQLMTAMNARMAADPEMQNNPFAGLAMMMIPGMVTTAIDAYVTPDGIANIVKGQKPKAATEPTPVASPSEEPKTSYGYTDIDTFKVTIDSSDSEPMALVMRRQGLFTWQMKRIELPADLLKEDKP